MESKCILDLDTLIRGPIDRLRNIIRYSNAHRLHDESVAEHSFYTALYSMAIGRDLILNRPDHGDPMELDMGVLLTRALLHDVEESQSGDFIRMFKHSSPELWKAIDSANHRFARAIFECINRKDSGLLVQWKHSKDDSLEGRIVRFADFLCVLTYMWTEVDLGNRRILSEHMGNKKAFFEYLQTFSNAPGYRDELRPYVKQAEELVDMMFPVRGPYEKN